MLLLALSLSLQAAAPDSTYSSTALRALVAEVAAGNRMIPASLAAYRARTESEIGLLVRSPQQENVMQLEQVESDFSWNRGGRTEQRVIGYRSQAFSMNVSAMTWLRRPWVVPILYGNRLRLIFGDPDALNREDDGSDLVAIHPLADDRDEVYRFEGGDTVLVMHLEERTIPVVRVRVDPAGNPPGRTLLFRGDIDIDAVRKQVIRMRGEFLVRRPSSSLLTRAMLTGFQPLAFAELVNAEVDQSYWLPSYQRVEVQVRSPLATGTRPVFRVITRFRDYAVNDHAGLLFAGADPARRVERLTLAPSDSVNAFSDWMAEIGTATASVRSQDFDDVMSDEWNPHGGPRLDFHAERFTDIIRSNRVEGPFTGIAARFRMRDAMPGASFGAHAGWAWTEETVRGAVSAEIERPSWTASLRAGRALASTNDFVRPLESGAGTLALVFTDDEFDYVDRRSASLVAGRMLGGAGGTRLRVELEAADDRPEIARLKYGLFHGSADFRPNRVATPGTYVRSAIGLDYHPHVSGEFLEPGVGGSITYEHGVGGLRWQRIDALLVGRRTWGPVVYGARIDAGAVLGRTPPPQRLIEFGANEGLPGYGYKEFGGDRAALARLSAAYRLPVLQSPTRITRWIYLPSLSPSIAVGFQSGWAAASPATRLAMAGFGPLLDSESGQPVIDPATGLPFPATRASGGVRSTVSLSLRFFGGAVGVGVARALDHKAPWMLTLSTNQQW